VDDDSFTVRVQGIPKRKFAQMVNESIPLVLSMGGPGSKVLRS
jgi:hypothetical protein